MGQKGSTPRVVCSTKLNSGEQAALRAEARVRGISPSEALRLASRMWVSASRAARKVGPTCSCGGSDDVGHSDFCTRRAAPET
jgi:hypothetical protein